ncbi:hypothetical protein [Krasilnikovia sp. MM14-A1259]|uniref:hypothetical protein n=1 Tax=Krasilnikovia sp. MM14-A1259 TaxID=3373539 RepID=UPI00382F4EFF
MPRLPAVTSSTGGRPEAAARPRPTEEMPMSARHTPRTPRQGGTGAAVHSLHEAAQRLLAGHDGVRTEIFDPEAGVAIILPSGYRWQVHVPHSGAIDVGVHHAVLCSPDRNPLPAAPLITLADVADVVSLVSSAQAGPVAKLIDVDLLARMEIDLFDPDSLLDEGV